MKLTFKKGMVVAGLALGVIVSNAWSKPKEVIIDFNTITNSNSSAVEKSSATSTFAERLAYSDAMPFALQHFEDALKLDPNNLKAEFYVAILRVVEAQRGLAGRIIPVVAGFPFKDQTEYANRIDEIPRGNFKAWATQSPGNMYSEADGSVHIKNTMNAFYSLRTVLAKLRDSGQSITINMFKVLEKHDLTVNDVVKYCPVYLIRPGVYQVSACPYQKKETANLNFADFEALRLIAGGAIAQLAPALGYSSEGVINIAKKFSGRHFVSDKVLNMAIKNEPKLGTLQDLSYLKIVTSMGAEAVEGYRMATRLQGHYCPDHFNQKRNRPGQLFYTGFCTDPDFTKVVELTNATMYGQTHWTLKEWNGTKYKTSANFRPFFDGDLRDLKTQLPVGYDRCGNATTLADNSLGGILPNKDAKTVLAISNIGYLEKQCWR